MVELNASLVPYYTNTISICTITFGDFNFHLLKANRLQFNGDYLKYLTIFYQSDVSQH